MKKTEQLLSRNFRFAPSLPQSEIAGPSHSQAMGGYGF